MSHAITSFPGIARALFSLFLPTEITSRSVFHSCNFACNGNSLKERKKERTVHAFVYLRSLLYLPLWSGERHFEPAGSKLNRVNPSKLGPAGTNACVRVLRWHGALENWINIRAGCRDKFHRSPTENFGLRDRDTRFSSPDLAEEDERFRPRIREFASVWKTFQSINERVYFRRRRREQCFVEGGIEQEYRKILCSNIFG